MAVPTYTTDLTPISACDALGTWVEPTATGWLGGAVPGLDAENFIQGTGAISKAFNAALVGGMIFNYASGISIPSGNAFFLWVYWASPKTIASEANGGLRAICGDLINAFKAWTLGGNDTYIYGGWESYAIDPNLTADFTAGSPTGVWQWFGFCVNNLDAITKGNPMLTDMYRYGRGEMRINGGEAANYATFPGFAAQNDNSSNRWGLFRAIPGGYSWKGLMTLGYTSLVDFRDSDRNIVIENTKKVVSTFNKIEIRQATSRVDWTRINIVALGTVSRGDLEVIDNADVNLNTCVFTDMNTFIFLSGTAALNCTFRRCSTITAPGCNLTGSTVDSSTVAADTSAVVWNVATDPSGLMDDMTFTKGTNAHHAIEFGISSPTTLNLSGITFSGFNASNALNDSALHIMRTTGTVTVNASGCTGAISYKSAGATVNVVSTVNLTLTGLISLSDIVILNAGTSTERVNVNENVGTTYIYGYTYVVDDRIDIGVFKAGYVPLYVRNFLLAATNTSLPIAQEIDRYYLE